MPLTDDEKKVLKSLQEKEGDPEEIAAKKRADWIDKQIAKEEKDAADKAAADAKKAEDDKKKKRRFF